MRQLADKILRDASGVGPKATPEQPVVLLNDEPLAEARVAAHILARFSHLPFAAIFNHLRKQEPSGEASRVITAALEKRGTHDAPPREFEHAVFAHEIIVDYGAWRDIQRHRICTPLNQVLDVSLGFDVPAEITEIGLAEEFRTIMQRSADFHHQMLEAGLGSEAEYMVPMAFRRRMIVTWNLRELFHFIELRSGPKGHPAYRRVAQETWRTLHETHPDLARHIRVDLSGASSSTLGAKPKGV